MKRLATAVLMIVAMSCSAMAQSSSLLPVIPRGKGDACVADRQFMRENHMKLLSHDRDETVLFGDRTVKHSLKQCIECHAVNGADARPVDIQNGKHFCRVCHDYAAVKVDCFQCHNSKPDARKQVTSDHDESIWNDLAAYLSKVKQ